MHRTTLFPGRNPVPRPDPGPRSGGSPVRSIETVYVGGSTFDLATPGDTVLRGVRPDVSELHHLVDAGHRVVVIGDRLPLDADPRLEARISGSLAAIPHDATGWYVSDLVADLGRAPAGGGVRTLYIGPAEDREGIQRPADVVARDLRAAVLAILADDAMGELPAGR